MANSRDAVQTAVSFIKEHQELSDLRIEQASFDRKENEWEVQLSFAGPNGEQRSYKRFLMTESQGKLEVVSMHEWPPPG